MRRRSRLLLETLSATKELTIIPYIAVAELLLGIDRTQHGQYITELQERFFLAPFDLRATAYAASLWQDYRGLPKDQQIERTCLKADVLIVATAKVHGATKVFSHDPKFRKLADFAGMAGRDLPTHSEDMFVDLEARQAAEEEDATN
jgi:predicted nucleic acid-binding protein